MGLTFRLMPLQIVSCMCFFLAFIILFTMAFGRWEYFFETKESGVKAKFGWNGMSVKGAGNTKYSWLSDHSLDDEHESAWAAMEGLGGLQFAAIIIGMLVLIACMIISLVFTFVNLGPWTFAASGPLGAAAAVFGCVFCVVVLMFFLAAAHIWDIDDLKINPGLHVMPIIGVGAAFCCCFGGVWMAAIGGWVGIPVAGGGGVLVTHNP